jgi:hypothetical protein
VLRGENGSCLLLRSDFYGGEHDHYDRLGLLYQRNGETLIPDLGTTGYGAKLHYAYYKNTASHNTVNIDGKNQPPADAALQWVEERDGVLCLEAVCDWAAPFQMPDSFTIPQWDEEAYRGVKMTRRIAWSGTWWAELFIVEGAKEGAAIDWVMHPRADGPRVASPDGRPVDFAAAKLNLPEGSPYSHLSDFRTLPKCGDLTYTCPGGGAELRLFSRAFGGTAILCSGPDNPSYKQIPYIIESARGPKAVFAHVIDCDSLLRGVDFAFDGTHMRYDISFRQGGSKTIEL